MYYELLILYRPGQKRFDCQLTETVMIYDIIEHVYTTKLAYCQQKTLHFWYCKT